MKLTAKEITSLKNLSDRSIEVSENGQTELIVREDKVFTTIACQPHHLQTLKGAGIRIDFSNKRVGLRHNQNSIEGTQNSVRVGVTFDLGDLEMVNRWSRAGTHRGFNFLCDHDLKQEKFPFVPSKIKDDSRVTLPEAARKSAKILRQRIQGNGKALNVNRYAWLRLQDARYVNECV